MPARRPPSTSGTPRPSPTVQRQLRGIRTGITLTALLGGLALYLFLDQRGMPGLLSGILGFLFALAGRFAMFALVRDWLLRTAARPTSGASRESDSRQP